MSVTRFLLVVFLATIAVSHAANDDKKITGYLTALKHWKATKGANITLLELAGNGCERLCSLSGDFVYIVFLQGARAWDTCEFIAQAVSYSSTKEEGEHKHMWWFPRYLNWGENMLFEQSTCKRYYHWATLFHLTGKETWNELFESFCTYMTKESWKLALGDVVVAWACVWLYRRNVQPAVMGQWSAGSITSLVVFASLRHFLTELKFWKSLLYLQNRVHQPLSTGDQLILQKSKNCTCEHLFLVHWGIVGWPLLILFLLWILRGLYSVCRWVASFWSVPVP
jgi:hypothetical protein